MATAAMWLRQIPAPIVIGVLVVAAALALYSRIPVVIATVIMMALLPASVFTVHKLMYVDMKRPATYAPRHYPVFVIGQTAGGVREPRIIYSYEIPELPKRYASWSFLVDPNDVRRMQKAVETVDGRSLTGEQLWYARFEVSMLPDGRQRFEVQVRSMTMM